METTDIDGGDDKATGNEGIRVCVWTGRYSISLTVKEHGTSPNTHPCRVG